MTENHRRLVVDKGADLSRENMERRRLKERVNERRDHAGFADKQQAANDQHRNYDRIKPELIIASQEVEEFNDGAHRSDVH